MKLKQERAKDAYAAVLEGRERARAALVTAEGELAGAEAEGVHTRTELEASQASLLGRVVDSCCGAGGVAQVLAGGMQPRAHRHIRCPPAWPLIFPPPFLAPKSRLPTPKWRRRWLRCAERWRA